MVVTVRLVALKQMCALSRVGCRSIVVRFIHYAATAVFDADGGGNGVFLISLISPSSRDSSSEDTDALADKDTGVFVGVRFSVLAAPPLLGVVVSLGGDGGASIADESASVIA